MIGKLKGIVEEIAEDCVLVDVQGVCYVVFCSDKTIAGLGAVGNTCSLMIETYVREDQLKLFGFATAREKQWFLLLQTVQGIGAKLALAVLSRLSPGEIANAIALQDKVALSKTPGVGPKAAERIVLELKNKLPHDRELEGGAVAQLSSNDPAPVAEAVSALMNLGYNRERAALAVAAAIKLAGEIPENTKLIRLALRELAR